MEEGHVTGRIKSQTADSELLYGIAGFWVFGFLGFFGGGGKGPRSPQLLRNNIEFWIPDLILFKIGCFSVLVCVLYFVFINPYLPSQHLYPKILDTNFARGIWIRTVKQIHLEHTSNKSFWHYFILFKKVMCWMEAIDIANKLLFCSDHNSLKHSMYTNGCIVEILACYISLE